ncbi:MAG: aldehyde dehydrogenase [Myxococcales bacterium]|nr:aldehyde dehydrogenase [Myxococcales bacterium]
MADHQKAAEALSVAKLGKALIRGEWRESAERFPSVDPTSGQQLVEVSLGREAEVDAAVRAAREAFAGPWSELSPGKRRDALERLAQLTESKEKELAQLEALDVGTPVVVGRKMTAKAPARGIAYYASWMDKLYGDVVPLTTSQPMLDFTMREPVGVVAAIIPWNTPLVFIGAKVGAALACGNSVVIKPSEVAPLSVLRWAELCREAGLPDGVVNVVPGDGQTGALLCGHPEVDLVSFTGGCETGAKVARAAAGKRLALELGGKSAAVVFADADLDKAAMAVALSAFGLSGQTCAAPSRLLVEDQVHDAVLEKLVELSRSLSVGDPLEPSTVLGPLASQAQLRKVSAMVASGKQEARLVSGGERLGGELSAGFFFAPTVFDEVKPPARIFREEIFGPVLSVTRFSGEDEAVALANGTSYGLAAGVFSRDLSRAHRVTRRLRAGMVWVNGYGQLPVQAPFGGTKGSGFGREGGRDALETFTQVKNVLIEL